MKSEKPLDIDPAIFEHLATKQYLAEPFARAIVSILVEKGICTNKEAMDMLDKVMISDLKRGREEWDEINDKD
ncbi:MAG: hypothetical protein ABF449_02880 [Ethanoligenens sp.]